MSIVSVNRRRILSLWLAYLPTDRIKRLRRAAQTTLETKADSRAPAEPLIVAAKINNELKISSVDEAAAALGFASGLPLATARAMHPALDIVDHAPDADAALLDAIADWCHRYTPLVALDSPHGLFLDITGCAHLFGGEAPMLHTICASLSHQGFGVSAAIAGTGVAARALARHAHGRVVVAGDEAPAVTPLPVSALGVEDSIIRGLRRAGLSTIGEVAARAPSEIAARFGEAFVDILQQALGLRDAPLCPRKPAPDYLAEKRFAEPVSTDAAISQTLSSLAQVLIAAMERHGKGARRMEASFFRTDGAVRTIGVETGQAVADATVLMRLFGEKLGALADPLDPGFGFDLIRLSASYTADIAPFQQGFDTHAHEAADVGRLVDRLAARLGSQRIVRYAPQDSHIPERADFAMPAQHAVSEKAWPAPVRDEPPSRPLRLFARPESISGVFAQVPDGPPARFIWRRVTRHVVRAEGPERIAMEWWRRTGQLLTRDYFRVEDEAGLRFWVYRDGLFGSETLSADGEPVPPDWFLHGLFA